MDSVQCLELQLTNQSLKNEIQERRIAFDKLQEEIDEVQQLEVTDLDFYL